MSRRARPIVGVSSLEQLDSALGSVASSFAEATWPRWTRRAEPGLVQLASGSAPTTHIAKNCEPPP